MPITISIPSKTFIIGDYISLVGAPALILNTEPRFGCLLEKSSAHKNTFNHQGFHPQSPAGKFIQKYKSDFAGYRLSFFDPYQGLGGFGASSAQFIMASAARAYAVSETFEEDTFSLKIYQDLAWSGVGLPPSGADCVGQYHGHICYYHKAANQLKTLVWPFPDIDFCLLHTGHKVNTYQHLQEISLDIIPVGHFEAAVLKAFEALHTANIADFIDALSEYARLQKEAGLLAITTQNLLAMMIQKKGVLFAKGCGALGADVILVLLERACSLSFVSSMQRRGLRVSFVGNETSRGFTYDLAG